MPRAKGHIPRYPRGFIILRILQFILNIAILGLVAYASYKHIYTGGILMLAASGLTFFVAIWLICAHSCAPRLYNYWAVFVFEFLLLGLWLASVALLVYQTANYWAAGAPCTSWNCPWTELTGSDAVYGTILAAASGLGAVQFFLFNVSLIIHAVVIRRHRRQTASYNLTSGTVNAPYQVKLKSRGKTDYESVPQLNVPLTQDTAYNPQHTYAPEKSSHPQKQKPTQVRQTAPLTTPSLFYQPPPPAASQHTDSSTPLAQGMHQPPH